MFSIEGNIGCGKTTLIQRIKRDNYFVLEEPIDLWTNYKGYNLLRAFYNKPERYGYMFQRRVLETQINQHKLRPHIIERSITSTRYCFTQLLYQQGSLTELEYALLQASYDEALHQVSLPKAIIYLRSDPSNLAHNIAQRGREEEQHINPLYLLALHNVHDDWLVKRTNQETRPIIIVDTAQYYHKIDELYAKLQPIIKEKVELTPGITIRL